MTIALLLGCSWAMMLPTLWPLWASVSVCVCGIALLYTKGWGAWLGTLLFGLGWAMLWGHHANTATLPTSLEARPVHVAGQVIGLPVSHRWSTHFYLRVSDGAGQVPALRGRLLRLSWTVRGPRPVDQAHQSIRAGSHWRLTVILHAPRGLVNPGGFDTERSDFVRRLTAVGVVQAERSNQCVGFPSGLDAWRERVARRIADRVPYPAQAYLRAFAIGDTRGLLTQDWQIMQTTGLTHLLAISGFHVGLVATMGAHVIGVLWLMFPRLGHLLPRQQVAAVASAVAASGYALVSGLSLPTLRTVLMIGAIALARLCQQYTLSRHVLALALMVVLLSDPLAILLPGFWLSFAGVACLVIYFADHQHAPWQQFLSAQKVAMISLLPPTLAFFNQVSVIGPGLNLLVIPWWSFVVIPLSLLALVVDPISPGLGSHLWTLAGHCFAWLWPIIRNATHMSFGTWWVPEPSWLAIGLASLGVGWWLMPHGTPGRWQAQLLVLPLVWPTSTWPRHQALHVVILDVGQGLSVIVRTKRHTLLYDTGPASPEGFDAGARVVVPALRALGVNLLDALVISHADLDHAGGVAAVSAAIPIKQRFAPPMAPLARVQSCLQGQGWQWDGVWFEYLHPPLGFPYLGNASSCVLRVRTAATTMILPGDIPAIVEQRLLREGQLQRPTDLVVVPHHGSLSSSSMAFIHATSPRLAIISAGAQNRFHHPHPEVVARWQAQGAQVRITTCSGAIRIAVTDQGVQVHEQRHWRPRLWDAIERDQTTAILSAQRAQCVYR